MEYKLLELLFGGGYLAIFAFLAYNIYEMKKKQEKTEDKINQSIDELKNEMAQIQKEKLSIEEFYRMFSGWREEIREINNKIDNLKDAIIKKELLK